MKTKMKKIKTDFVEKLAAGQMTEDEAVAAEQYALAHPELIEKPKIDQEAYIAALFDAEDMFERLMAEMIVLNQTAVALKESKMFDGSITVGIKAGQLTREALATLATEGKGGKWTDNNTYEWEKGGVKIIMKVIRFNADCFTHPDEVMFRGEPYKLPNPMDAYWMVESKIFA